MPDSADKTPMMSDSLDEDSDVIELTEEVTPPKGEEELDLQMPAFRLPSGEHAAAISSRDDDIDEPEAFDREELVRTVRMEAFDRSQLELVDTIQSWKVEAHLQDQSLAPDIIISPPRVLTRRWQDGAATKKNGAAPRSARPVKGPALEEVSNPRENSDTIEDLAVETARDSAHNDFEANADTDRHYIIPKEDASPSTEAGQQAGRAPENAPVEPSRNEEASATSSPSPQADDSNEIIDLDAIPDVSMELESEVEESFAQPVQPPPKPVEAQQQKRQPNRKRQSTQPMPRRPPQPTPMPPAVVGAPQVRSEPARKEEDDDLSGIVQELLEERKPARTAEQVALERRANWFLEFFSEEYLRTLPKNLRQQTERDVGFIVENLGLKKSAKILDLACGFGRHAVELAGREYEVAGLDLSMPMLQIALNEAQRRELTIKFIHGDMRELNFQDVFDGAYCWQTSFGYFDDRTNVRVLQGLHRALKTGGRLLIDCANRDYVVQEMPSRTWWEGVECVFLEEVEFDHLASVLHTKRSFIYEDGSPPREFNSFIRLYSLNELSALLRFAGFRILEVSGEHFHRGRYLGAASTRLVVLAEKIRIPS